MSAEKRPSLLKIPGQTQDPAARERRKKLQELDLPGEELIKELLPETIGLEGSEQRTESYAVASFVIERMWDALKERIPSEGLASNEKTEEGDTIPKQFIFALNRALDTFRDQFRDEFRDSLDEKSDSDVSKSDVLVLRYLQLMREETGRSGFPSMKDLVTMIGRMADVVPKVYERDLGRVPTEEELFAALEHPSLKRLFMEMMTNSRAVLGTVIIRMEGGKDVDLDDYTREFDPAYFTLQPIEHGQYAVIFRPEVAKWFRDTWARVAETRAEEGKESPRALQCPVLYTGSFIEMYDWVTKEFRQFSEKEGNKSYT